MASELKVIAAAKETEDAFRRAAALLAEQGKWRAAATAQESGGDSDDARLLLAYFILRSGDPDRADQLLAAVSEQQRGSLAAHWVAAELAVERNDAETAVEELESARVAGQIDPVFRSICCRGRTIDSAALDALLRSRIALLRDDAATAMRLSREIETPEGQLVFARALRAAGRIAEAVRKLKNLARELPPCAGVWREHVLFEAALAAAEFDTTAAEKLYEEAIEVAEAQEVAFTTAVHEADIDLQKPVTGLFVAAMREPRHAAPESRNNLGHLLIARANGDIATLAIAQSELRKAAQSRDYETPQYAYIGLARAALAADDREVAAKEVMKALWRAPQHDDALETARTLIRNAPIESRLELGIVFTATTSETLPRRFVTREYGRELTQLDEVAATHDHELARHFAGVRALARSDFDGARRLATAARTQFPSSDWPDAVEAAGLAATGKNGEAQTVFRALRERVSRHPPRTPWDAATLRIAALAFSDVAKEGDDPGARTAAAALIAEVARPAVASGRPFPWEPRTGLTGSVAEAATNTVLPGGEITVFTEAGPQKVSADENGQWRVRDLPSGSYSVLARFAGMQSSGRIVNVTTGENEVAFALKHGSVDEVITVTGAEPLIQLPQMERVYSDIASLAPGVSVSGISIDGASYAENRFFMDGVSTTASVTYSQEVLLSSAIKEISILTSGISAEYGSDSASIVSAVSRTGTNDVDGKVTLEVSRDQESAEPVAMPRALANERHQELVRFHAGGPLQRDQIHWFVSGDLQQHNGEPQPALSPQLTPRGETRAHTLELFGKLSGSFPHTLANLAARKRQAAWRGVVDDSAGSAFGAPSSVDRRQKTRNDALTARIDVIPTATAGAEIMAYRTRERSSLLPGSDRGNTIQFRVPELGFFTDGGVGLINDGRDVTRTGVQAKVSTFLPGEHELVAGVDAEWDEDALSDRISGGMLIEANNDSRRFWTYGDDPRAVAAVHEMFEGNETSAYVADTWKSSRLTLQVGFRWTRQTAGFPRDFKLSTSALQPRLGVAHDPIGNGRWNIYANYARLFESIRRDERVAYGSDRRYVIASPDPVMQFKSDSYGRLSAIDPDLRARLSDVWGAGVEHGGPWHWQLGAQYHLLASHIEDFFCTNDRRRCIGNPGSGIMRQSPRARREHVNIIGRIWHDSRSFSWEVAYTWLHAEGNTEPPDLPSTRVAGIDPYARAAFDNNDFVSDGKLALPQHFLKAQAFATAHDLISTDDVVLSASLIAQSGVPRGAFGYSPLYGRYVTTVVSRGELSDGPTLVSLHAGIDYVIPIGKSTLKLSLIGRNLLDSQTSRVDDQRSVLPAYFRETIPNPTFLQPMERNEPRSLRVLVALTF